MKKIIRFIPALIWMSVIFYFSTRSTAGVPGNFTERFLILKSFHLIEYGFLAILLYFAYQKIRPTIFTAYIFAISDEIHQSFTPGRTPKFADTLIDLFGITLGLLILKFIISPLFLKLNKYRIQKRIK